MRESNNEHKYAIVLYLLSITFRNCNKIKNGHFLKVAHFLYRVKVIPVWIAHKQESSILNIANRKIITL